jgi:hypothetical protein
MALSVAYASGQTVERPLETPPAFWPHVTAGAHPRQPKAR